MSCTGTVVGTERLGPHLVRVVLGGSGLDGFSDPEWADSYVNAQFPAAHGETVPRRITVRRWDPASRELTLDIAVHGDSGAAGAWAQRARPGDELALRGPAGGYTPDPLADAHLLVGDTSALPAIAAALEQVGDDVAVHVVLQVPGPADEIALGGPAGVHVRWVHGDGEDVGLLAAAVAELDRPAGDLQVFVHGEAESVRAVRRLLLGEWAVPRARASISPYWRFGHTDEQWRQVKAAWTRTVEEDLPG